jgi:hypothetical protein
MAALDGISRDAAFVSGAERLRPNRRGLSTFATEKLSELALSHSQWGDDHVGALGFVDERSRLQQKRHDFLQSLRLRRDWRVAVWKHRRARTGGSRLSAASLCPRNGRRPFLGARRDSNPLWVGRFALENGQTPLRPASRRPSEYGGRSTDSERRPGQRVRPPIGSRRSFRWAAESIASAGRPRHNQRSQLPPHS